MGSLQQNTRESQTHLLIQKLGSSQHLWLASTFSPCHITNIYVAQAYVSIIYGHNKNKKMVGTFIKKAKRIDSPKRRLTLLMRISY